MNEVSAGPRGRRHVSDLPRAAVSVRPASGLAIRPESELAVPSGWLRYVDSWSYAGRGHGSRVALLAHRLSQAIDPGLLDVAPAGIAAAACCHELGRLGGPVADRVELAVRSSVLLAQHGCDARVVRAVRHMHERWDGTGGPLGLAGDAIPRSSLILSVADAVDHYIAVGRRGSGSVAAAIDRAIGLVLVQRRTVFCPLLASALQRERSHIRVIVSD
jgi:hypothetical protein